MNKKQALAKSSSSSIPSTQPIPPKSTPLAAASSCNIHDIHHSPTQKTLEAAYIRGVTNGNFYDVVLYAYSCKTISGTVCKPRPVYANSSILEFHSSYFRSLLSSSFIEKTVTNIDAGFPADKPSFTRDYDYDCDSDLESISEDDFEDEKSRDVVDQLTEGSKTPVDPPTVGTLQTKGNDFLTSRTVRLGRTILIPGVAFLTLRSIVSYLIMENPEFLPLKSSGKPRFSHDSLEKIYSGVTPCSPKSAYRAADMFQLEWLRLHAVQNIKSQLTADNILEEIFSRFTSTYDEVAEVQTDYLSNQGKSQRILETLPLWIAKVSEGELTHGSTVLLKIISLWLQDPNVLPVASCSV